MLCLSLQLILSGHTFAVRLFHVWVQMLDGSRQSAQLMAINASDPEGWAPGHPGPTGTCLTGAVSSPPGTQPPLIERALRASSAR